MANYTLTRFVTPNAAPAVSLLGSDPSTTAALGNAVQNFDTYAAAINASNTFTAGQTITTGGLQVTAGASAFGGTMVVGSISAIAASRMLQVHQSTDANFGVLGKQSLADGLALESVNDAANALKGLELRGSAIYLQAASGVSVSNALTLLSIGTTASAANVFYDNGASNNLLRSTSSLRYKDVTGDLGIDWAKPLVMGLRPFAYRSKSDADDPEREWVGLAAEHLHDADARLVTVVDGQPDWVMYERLVAPLALVAQDHESRLKAMEAQIAA